MKSEWYFNPRTPLQSATSYRHRTRQRACISIHALHYRVRRRNEERRISRTSISIHALHYRVRRAAGGHRFPTHHISIHALHYRVRRLGHYLVRNDSNISIHALHYRVRLGSSAHILLGQLFQSTHSITECDPCLTRVSRFANYFNPRTPLQSATATYSGLFCYITSCG